MTERTELTEDSSAEDAETVFRRKFREKLAARGYKGDELERKVEAVMNAPVRFHLDTDDAAE